MLGQIIHSYASGVIIRPIVFQPQRLIPSYFDWNPILFKGVGDVILISPRNPNGWRIFTIRIVARNKANTYIFNVEYVFNLIFLNNYLTLR